MPLIDDSGRRIVIPPKPKPPKKKPKSSTAAPDLSFLANSRYPKPKAMSGLPKWAQEVRAGADFMPIRVKPVSYTALAKAEAARGYKHRPMVFGPANWATPTVTNTKIGGYFKPTEDVAKGVIQERNLWQDIKNLGSTVLHKGGSLAMGALDLVSRPLYALENVYKDKLERHYTAADSAGGADVTGFEALKAFVGTITPFGAVKDVVSGDFDDRVKKGWAGLSGKEKTTTHDVLKLTNPEFVAEHPKLTFAASLAGDILFDPLTWLTMGTNPGSIAKAGGSTLKFVSGDKLAASRLWNETLFTGEGRAAGAAAVKHHYQQQDLGRLGRQQGRIGKKLTKAQEKAAKGKDTAAKQAKYKAKSQVVAKKYADKMNEDLQGAALAWRVLRKGYKTAFTMPISRYNTGAGASTAIRGAQVLTNAHRDFNMSVAEKLQSEDRWKALFVANQFRDFDYYHAGQKITVKLSEASTLKDFIYKISSEANQLADYQEHGKVAARARGSHIKTVEGRGNSFMSAFKRRYEDEMIEALGPDTGKRYDKLRGFHEGRAAAKEEAESATQADIENPEFLTLDDDAFIDPNLTFDTLKDEARKTWQAAHPNEKYTPDRAAVLYRDINGNVKKIHLSALKQMSDDFAKQRLERLAEKSAARQRTPGDAAVDALTGVSDNVAASRARFMDLGDMLRQEREADTFGAEINVHEAEAELAAYTANWESKINKIVDSSPEFTDAEKVKYKDILKDKSLSVEERFAKILEDSSMSNEEVADLVEDVFKVVIDNNGTVHLPKGGSIQDIPKLIRAVLFDRFQHRMTDAMQEASGYGIEGDVETGLRLTYAEPSATTADVKYMRDVNGEIGMMLMDGYRAAINYAVETEALRDDPEALLNVLHQTASEFMDMATADTKSQVAQLMYSTFGVRFPERFIPVYGEIDNLIGGKGVVFKDKNGDALTNQELPWTKLFLSMENWVADNFAHFLPVERLEGTDAGVDLFKLSQHLVARASGALDELMPGQFNPGYIDKIEYVDEVMSRINVLQNMVGDQAFNGSMFGVSNYTMLDFILYSKEIIKAQETTVRVTSGTQRINVGRLSALDSFTFLDPVAISGLEALDELKALTRGSDQLKAALAQKALSALFIDNGGLQHLNDLSQGDLTSAFKSLGIHAKLKEGALRRNSPFGMGHSMQLLDAMWGKATVNHELQKALQNEMVSRVWVDGATEAQTAEALALKADKFFAGHERLKKLIHPTGGALEQKLSLTEKAPTPVTRAPAQADQAAINTVKGAETAVQTAEAHLQDMINKVNAAKAGGMDNPLLLDELRIAREEYLQAMKDAPGGSTAPTGATSNSADFANVADDIIYTDDEVEQIKKYIGASYDEANPDILAKQLHAMSIALTGDIFTAQQGMRSALSDLNIKYGVNAKFMGIPLVPLGPGPGNVTKTVAGVVAYEQSKGHVANFLTEVISKFTTAEKGKEVYEKISRPSTLFEGGLERIRMGVVNYAGFSRKIVLAQLEDFYAKALGSEFNSAAYNAMKRKDKFKYLREAIFTPTAKGVPDRIDEFKLPDGSNPVFDLAKNFEDSARVVFGDVTAKSVDATILEIGNFNRYMLKEYRLDDGTLSSIYARMHIDPSFAGLTPYSREWFQEVGQMGHPGSSNRFRTERMLKVNLGRFHYAMQDAKLKYQSGRALNEGVFKQFAFRMDPSDAAMYNKNIVPNTLDVHGKPMRGPMVPITEKGIGPTSQWAISTRHIPAKYLDSDYYITSDLLPEIKLMFDYIDGLGELSDALTTGFMQKVFGYFKASVTIYKVPGYPVRNLISDVLMSAFDGLLNPIYYKYSGQLLNEFSKAMKEIDIKDYDGIFDGGMLKNEMLKGAHDPSSVLDPAKAPPTPFELHLVTAAGPIKLNGSQVMELYNTMGLGQNRVSGEIAESLKAARQSGKSVQAGKLHDLLRNTNDVREDFARVAHFIYALEREAPLGGDAAQIARRAGLRVVKNHFDYNDVSLFERKYLAPWLPFYKWTRNVVPYTLSMMISKPVALKAETALNTTIGFMIDDDLDDSRRDLVIPEWIEYDMAVPIGSFIDENNNEFGRYASLSMPLTDTLKRTLGPALNPMFDPALSSGQKGLDVGAGAISVGMAMLNPVAKGLIQAPTHQQLWPTGGAPENNSWLDTMMTSVPGKVGLETLMKGQAGPQGNVKAWVLEQAGAINVSNNTERSQLGELNRREDYYRAQLNKRKDEIMVKMKEKFPSLTPDQQKMLMDEILKRSREGDPDRVK